MLVAMFVLCVLTEMHASYIEHHICPPRNNSKRQEGYSADVIEICDHIKCVILARETHVVHPSDNLLCFVSRFPLLCVRDVNVWVRFPP